MACSATTSRTFNHRKPPKTAAGLKQKPQGLTPTQRWWFDKLNAGRLLPWHDGWRREVLRTELHDNYVLVLQKAGVNRRATETELAISLREHLVKGRGTVRRTMEVRVGEDKEGRPRVEKRNERCWVLANLTECRKQFEKLMTLAIEWEPVDDAPAGDPDPKLDYDESAT